MAPGAAALGGGDVIPSPEEVKAHQEAYPLVEAGEGVHAGITWEHGACWLTRKPMLCSSQLYPQILRLREKEGRVLLSLGFAQWVPLETMPWATLSEWEPVDQHGRPLP